MRRMPLTLHGLGGVGASAAAVAAAAASSSLSSSSSSSSSGKQQAQGESAEPRSVLDHRRSPSPPTSTSTLSAEVAAVSDDPAQQQPWKEEWGDLQPLPLEPSAMDDDWDSLLHPHDTSSSLLRWVLDPDPHPPQLPEPSPLLDPSLLLDGFSGFPATVSALPLQPLYPEPDPAFSPVFLPAEQQLPPPPPFRPEQGVVEQLLCAAEQIEAANPAGAHAILARLNHLSPLHGKPLLRAAFYLREALAAALDPGRRASAAATPWDVVLKLTAHRAFSELSPAPHFAALTCVQALLEELPPSATRVHVLDLHLGAGAHWSSFLQELSHRHVSSPLPSLCVTALVSASSHHPLELALVQENLAHFAAGLGVPFELRVLAAGDPLDILPSDEPLAVHLPAAACAPPLLRLVRQLAPRLVVVVAVDHGGDRGDLTLPQRLLHSLRSSAAVLDSIEAAGAALDVAAGIGRFLLQPRIEESLSRARQTRALPWRTLLSSAGFSPVQFSNFAETQAECLLKRTPVRGFQVERRQSSLSLLWQREELVSISAWRC